MTWGVSADELAWLRVEYPRGTRVELDSAPNDSHTRLRAGDRGTVWHVDSMGTIHVRWDSGSGLGLIPDEDRFHKVKEDA